jgi:uncharacterized protein
MTQPVAVITGASTGIGAALARVFATHGHRLALVARREALLNALADEIAGGGKPRPLVLPLDLTQANSAERIRDALAGQDLTPQFMVNNAGFGMLGPSADRDRSEQLAMIDINVRTLVDLSLAFVDDLAVQKGGILNVASVASFLPGPGMAVYYASKSFVLSFSEALHNELAPRGIRVTILCPGPVPTEFQARAGIPEGYESALLGRSPEHVAEAAYRGLMAGRMHVVPGFANKLVTMVPRFMPRKLLVKMVADAQKSRFDTGSGAA